MYEYHDAPVGGHRGREKTYLTVSRGFYWPCQYQIVHKYVRACVYCQRVKSSPSLRALLQPLRVPADCWESVSMDFVFGFPADTYKITNILVFVDRFSRWYIWLLYPSQSMLRIVPVSLSTRSFAFMGCLVNSCSIGSRGSQLSYGVLRSKHSESA